MPFGWQVLYNGFPAITGKLRHTADALVAKAALDIEAQAKTRAPVDTGFLKNSIQAVKISEGHWRVAVGAEYGIYVEYGTRRSAAQPYFQPAIDAVKPGFLDAMRMIVG